MDLCKNYYLIKNIIIIVIYHYLSLRNNINNDFSYFKFSILNIK